MYLNTLRPINIAAKEIFEGNCSDLILIPLKLHSVPYFTMEVDPSLAKPLLNFSGGSAKRVFISLAK